LSQKTHIDALSKQPSAVVRRSSNQEILKPKKVGEHKGRDEQVQQTLTGKKLAKKQREFMMTLTFSRFLRRRQNKKRCVVAMFLVPVKATQKTKSATRMTKRLEKASSTSHPWVAGA
jgi:hypothetical protein